MRLCQLFLFLCLCVPVPGLCLTVDEAEKGNVFEEKGEKTTLIDCGRGLQSNWRTLDRRRVQLEG